MSEFPSMPLFSDAYIGDTAHLTLEEHGAYLLLLMSMWRNRGDIPDDDKDNARRLGLTVRKWKTIKARLAPMLEFYGAGKNAKISQKRLQQEWNKVANFRNRQSKKGTRSAEVRCKQKQQVSDYHGSSTVGSSVAAGLQPERQPDPNRNSTPIPNKNITTSSTLSPREENEPSGGPETEPAKAAERPPPSDQPAFDPNDLEIPEFLRRTPAEPPQAPDVKPSSAALLETPYMRRATR